MSKRLKGYCFWVLLSFLWYQTINAQSSFLLPLEQALTEGLSHSSQLKSDALAQKIASSKVVQTRQLSLPQVSLSASYLRLSDNIEPFKVNFPTGEVTLNPQILNQSYNALQVRQLIWNGGKLRYANELAQLEEKVNSTETAQHKNQIEANITSIWYQLYALRQAKKLLQHSLDLLNSQITDAKNRLAQGLLLENELLKIELASMNLETRLAEMKHTDDLLCFQLNTLLGRTQDSPIELPVSLPSNNEEDQSLQTLISRAHADRPELSNLAIRQQQVAINERLTRSDRAPSLSAGFSYNYDLPNQRLFPNQNVFTGTWNLGVFFQWNLSELYQGKEKINEQSLKSLQLEQVVNQAKEGIAMEVNARFRHLQSFREQVKFAEKALVQARKNYELEENRFRAGTTTATDFLAANTQFLNAEVDQVNASANASLAFRQLLQSIR